MSNYTTGEIAKLCGVSVRTVQYYDGRNILVPSALSEGGRRLYSEEDLKRMGIICFLRDMGFSLDNIGMLFAEESPEQVIALLISQQEQVLRKDLQQTQKKLDTLLEMTRSLKSLENFSVDSLGDIATVMKNQKKRRKMLARMLTVGILADIIEIAAIVYAVKTGIWWPLAVGLPIVIALCAWISHYYYRHAYYICPACHTVFHPTFKAMFFAAHTPNTRRLTCPDCGHKGFCVETYGDEDTK